MINTKRLAHRTVVALSLPATLAAVILGSVGAAEAASPFGTPGEIVQEVSDGPISWIVPSGVGSVHLHLVGGSGAAGGSGTGSPGGRGGYGGFADETVAVKPGQTLTLMSGSAAAPGGGETFAGDSFGGQGGRGNSNGNGGRGGAASWVTLDGRVVGIAGGGGGGGGGGAVYSYNGGQGGDARLAGAGGSGAGAGSAGTGNIAASESLHHGEDQTNDAPFASFAGGGGGGGAGWNGAGFGGGAAGQNGTYGGGGGGGAAGGLSWGIDPKTTYSTRKLSGDGIVVLDWTVGASTTSQLDAPAYAPQGSEVTLTDTVTPALTGGPVMTGTVTFEMQDINSDVTTVLGTAPLVDGVASYTTTKLPRGNTSAVHAIYGGDSNYQGSTSGFAYPDITAPLLTVALDPSAVAFGNQAVKTVLLRTVQITNTGGTDWAWDWAATDNTDVNMPATTCVSLKPRDTCFLTISYRPSQLGAITAHITMHSNFGTASIPVTGTGVVPAPMVTAVGPIYGTHLGGTRITVTGTNFVKVSSITVRGVKATAVSCSSATSCSATTPAGIAGAADVLVATATGTSALTVADYFIYR